MTEQGLCIDAAREARLGFDEAIYGAGKSVGQLDALVADTMASDGRRLFTRLRAEQVAALRPAHREVMDYDPVSRTGIVGVQRRPARPPAVAVLTAGASDAPVAGEAARTLAYYGQGALQVSDVGVAGLWRLLARVLVEHARRSNGRFAGRRWSSRAQPAAVEWGRGTDNLLLTEIANSVLAAAGRHSNKD